MPSRRTFLTRSAAAFMALAAGTSAGDNAKAMAEWTLPQTDKSPETLAGDEAYWAAVGRLFPKPQEIMNLEHGYWGQMALPVEAAFVANTRRVNRDLSIYARKRYDADFQGAIEATAAALAVKPTEIMLTRNATEAFVNLITQYGSLKKGDSILWADADYPSFQNMMQWLADDRGVAGRKIALPVSATTSELIQTYRDAIDATPNLKLLLITHVSNQHGMVLPVREIAAYAKARGIDVICDCAQSWGLIDFTLPDLGVDWAVFNLHKWIGSPVGVGALYMKKGTLSAVRPFPGEPPGDDDVQNRVHLATSNFASFITVPVALDFHRALGGRAQEMRLRHLRRLWVDEMRGIDGVEVLGARDAASESGMGAFRLRGQTSESAVGELQVRLENEFNIFTVVRKDLASGCNIRVTPQIFTPSNCMSALVDAIRRIVATS